MEILDHNFERGSLSVVIKDGEQRMRVATRNGGRTMCGRCKRDSRHDRMCQAMAIALQQMATGKDITSTR